VRHFLDGGTEGRFLDSQRVMKSTIPESLSPPRQVLWHDDVVMSAGLFPCLSPGARVYCPSHFFPTSWIARPLSTIKLLRLYQLPLSFDGFLGGLDPPGVCCSRTRPYLTYSRLYFVSCGVLLGGV